MQDGYREDRVILAHGAVQDRGVTPLLDDLVRRTTQRLGGGGGAVTLLGDRAPVVHRQPLPPVDDVLARLVREPRTLLMEGDGPGRSDVLGTPSGGTTNCSGPVLSVGVDPSPPATSPRSRDSPRRPPSR